MRASRHTLLLAVLQLFITLAVMPASAFYNPTTGRWLSRDSIQEKDTANLHSFCRNAAISAYDYLGNLTVKEFPTFTPQNCGAFSMGWNFKLDRAAPSGGGYIVQHIEIQETVTPCWKDTRSQSVSYWEAFEIGQGEFITVGAFLQDVWAHGEYGCAPTRGSLTMSGKAKFFAKNTTTGELGANTRIVPWKLDTLYGENYMGSCFGGWGTGGAPSVGSMPPFWNRPSIESSPKRTIKTEWNCCCPNKPENFLTRLVN
jgi:hypothetical protein